MPGKSLTSTRMAWGIVLINLLVIGMVVFSLSNSRNQAEERARITVENLSKVLGENISGDIDKIDLALQVAVDEYERQLASGKVDAAALTAFLGRQLGRLPAADNLRAMDAQGLVLYGLGVPTAPRINLADRDFYLWLQDHPHAGLVFGKPILARISKKWLVPLARRVNQPDGSFAGLVYSAITIEHFDQMFATLDVGRGGVVSLRDAEMGLIARHPERKAVGMDVGNKAVSPELQQLLRAGQTSGTYFTPTGSDNIARRVAFRKLGKLPLFIVVGVGADDYLATWHLEVKQLGGLAGLFALISGLFALFTYRAWQRQIAATESLAAQELKFRTVADYTFDWEYWQGLNQEIRYMSPAVERITGYTPAEFAADPDLLQRIVAPEDRPLMAVHLRDDIYHDTALVDFRIVRRDGSIRWITHGCRAVYDADGQFMGRRVSNRDSTERKQAEQELHRSNTELEQFSYTISHDMRQPLRMISSYLQLLERSLAGQLDGEKREYFNFAIDGAQRLDKMMVALLDYSRVGRKGEPPQWIASRALLDEALLNLQPAIAEAQATLRIEGDWPRILVRRDEMMRLIQNLIGNAVKYRVAGRPPDIAVSGASTEQGWRLSVADNGVGFAPNQVGRLFQVFQRLQSRSAYEGTGIGLALCRKIAEHHGGQIGAASAGEGQGSLFWVNLPVTVAGQEPGGTAS